MTSTRSLTRGRARRLVAATLLVGVVGITAACSGSDDGSSDGGSSNGGDTAAEAPAEGSGAPEECAKAFPQARLQTQACRHSSRRFLRRNLSTGFTYMTLREAYILRGRMRNIRGIKEFT